MVPELHKSLPTFSVRPVSGWKITGCFCYCSMASDWEALSVFSLVIYFVKWIADLQESTIFRHYLWVLFFKLTYSIKSICNPLIQYSQCFFQSFAGTRRAVKNELSSGLVPSWGNNTLRSVLILQKSVLMYLVPHFSCFFLSCVMMGFVLMASLFNRAPKHKAEVSSSVPKHRKAMMCLTGKIHVVEKFCSGTSSNTLGHKSVFTDQQYYTSRKRKRKSPNPYMKLLH